MNDPNDPELEINTDEFANAWTDAAALPAAPHADDDDIHDRPTRVLDAKTWSHAAKSLDAVAASRGSVSSGTFRAVTRTA